MKTKRRMISLLALLITPTMAFCELGNDFDDLAFASSAAPAVATSDIAEAPAAPQAINANIAPFRRIRNAVRNHVQNVRSRWRTYRAVNPYNTRYNYRPSTRTYSYGYTTPRYSTPSYQTSYRYSNPNYQTSYRYSTPTYMTSSPYYPYYSVNSGTSNYRGTSSYYPNNRTTYSYRPRTYSYGTRGTSSSPTIRYRWTSARSGCGTRYW